ncbi:ATP-grasp domain-containing protein [Azospirillum palustre]
MNLLVLNAGRRVELVRSFRDAQRRLGLTGKVWASDIQPYAPALYEADAAVRLPPSRSGDLEEALLALCRSQDIRLVIPTIDPDLQALADWRPRFAAHGITLLISPPEAVRICRSKRRTAEFLDACGLPVPRVWTADARTLPSGPPPWFVKPDDGSSGIDARRIETAAALVAALEADPGLVVQDFVEGDEFTVDVFSDAPGRAVLAVPRRRLRIRAGEVSVACVERDPTLEALACRAADRLGTTGPINVQIIRGSDGPFIIEVNPRFGGGSPLALRAGAPFAEWCLLMARGEPFSARSVHLSDGLVMMRYDQSVFLDPDGLLP